MQIYNYHPVTKEYTGHVELPRLPANAVKIAPPSTTTNQIAVYDKSMSQWQVKADYRNTTVYNKITGEQSIYNEIGEIPNTYTTLVLPSENFSEYIFSEANNRWEKKQVSLEEQKQELRSTLLSLLNGNQSNFDNPLLTSILLANISPSSLPIKISKNNLTEIETISDESALMAREAEIRSQLLERYTTIVGLADDLLSATNENEIAAIEEKVNKL